VVTPRGGHAAAVEYYGAEEYDDYDDYDASGRRRSHDDGHSYTSSHRSHRSKRSHRHRSSSQSRSALTESNLKTHSEVSATRPSAPSRRYRSPYAETAPRDMALSRPNFHPAAESMSFIQQPTGYPPAPHSVADSPRHSMLVHRPRSDPVIVKKKEIDMNLAYGDIPPDLESRVDLDIGPSDPFANAANEEEEAHTLMARIEALLDEAHCLHHTASAIISHLQGNPEAAAAVALTLAELSTLLGKLSPSFLGIVKGGSPAVFALLASPQFLIAAGVAVGVTVVMFGGWKIVKKIREANKEKQEAALAFEMQQQPSAPETVYEPYIPAAYGGAGSGFDEALVLEEVLDEELSTIESWRRGIQPSFGEDETADMELISPEAERRRREDDIEPDDSASGIGRSSRSHRTSKSHKSSHHRSSRRHEEDVPERKSSKGFKGRDDDKSESGSHRSSRSKRTEKIGIKAIEDGRKDSGNTLDSVLQKEKKPNMLKSLFKKKKEKEDKERVKVSVLV
jgi:hypothetical protein